MTSNAARDHHSEQAGGDGLPVAGVANQKIADAHCGFLARLQLAANKLGRLTELPIGSLSYDKIRGSLAEVSYLQCVACAVHVCTLA